MSLPVEMMSALQMDSSQQDIKSKNVDQTSKAGFAESESPLYHTDPFRMYCFKVLPCSKRYCHDWTFCPFAHPGEKAKRRDPRVYNYNGIACPEMKKNMACPRGDTCPYAHNVFEYWLHPSRYRTQLCNDGANCKRKVCFFAHTLEELRVPCKSLASEGSVQLDPFAPSSAPPQNAAPMDNRLNAAAAAAQAANMLKPKSTHLGLQPLVENDAWDHSLNSPIAAWNPFTWSSSALPTPASSISSASGSYDSAMLAMRRRSCEVQSTTPLVQAAIPRRHSIDHPPSVGVQQLAETLANLELAERLGGKQNIVDMLGRMLAREMHSQVPNDITALNSPFQPMSSPLGTLTSSPLLSQAGLSSAGMSHLSTAALQHHHMGLGLDQSSLAAANSLSLLGMGGSHPMAHGSYPFGLLHAQQLSQALNDQNTFPVTSAAIAYNPRDAAEADQLLSAAFSAAANGHVAEDLE